MYWIRNVLEQKILQMKQNNQACITIRNMFMDGWVDGSMSGWMTEYWLILVSSILQNTDNIKPLHVVKNI
mgnify:FL=1